MEVSTLDLLVRAAIEQATANHGKKHVALDAKDGKQIGKHTSQITIQLRLSSTLNLENWELIVWQSYLGSNMHKVICSIEHT
jgi:hypothetical protein